MQKTAIVGTARDPLQREHVACVCDGREHRLYVDGKLQGRKPLFSPLTGNAQFEIGMFAGTIDQVRVSKTARYAAAFAPEKRLAVEADTIALYRFDEGAGTTLKDSSPNKHDGKIVGAKWVTATAAPAIAPAQPSPDRAFAVWLRANDREAAFDIFVAGNIMRIEPTDKLPDQPFIIKSLERVSSVGLEGIPLLAKLSQLDRSYLPYNNADAWAAAIAQLPKVGHVNAHRSDITATGIASLGKMPKLDYLSLHECRKIDSAALRLIAKFPALKTLNLDGEMLKTGKYTLDDVRRLRKALPDCVITQDEGQPIVGLAAGAAIDLLSLVDPAKDVLAGDWTKDGDGFKSEKMKINSWLRLPAQPGEAYSLRLAFTTNRGNLSVVLPFEAPGLELFVSNKRIELCVKPLKDKANPIAELPDPLYDDKRHELSIEVARPSQTEVRITVAVDGKPALEWKGTRDELRRIESARRPPIFQDSVPALVIGTFLPTAAPTRLFEAKLTTTRP